MQKGGQMEGDKKKTIRHVYHFLIGLEGLFIKIFCFYYGFNFTLTFC